ncbi:MAG TPA: thioesterase family protein [Candidatus Limnocylindrales bacterium]|nr:thioesterase family protein [Candidatus Limnocylindrales bacterium]
MAPPRSRIDVPADPRDLPGDFAHRCDVEVRLSDTDAMGHVNNARYLTYVEIARVAYYEQVIGKPLPLGFHGAEEGMILAEVTMTYRAQAYFGETLAVESRIDRIGTTSFVMSHRMTAPQSRYGPARLVATSVGTLVSFDYATEKPIPVPSDWREAIAAYEGWDAPA